VAATREENAMLIEGDLSYAGISVVTVLSAGLGAYIGAHLKKKAENLATHEDIDKLLVQIKATTEATKSIEARISNEVWNRQREWEFKRETLLEGGRSIADFLAAIMRLNVVCGAKSGASKNEETAYLLALSKDETNALDAVNKPSYSLQRAQLVLSIVSGKQTQIAFVKTERLFKQIAVKIVDGDTKYFDSVYPQLKNYASDLTLAIRRELGFDDTEFTSQPEAINIDNQHQ
jgi:hypothetical protein